jgi:hypothetical protein
MPLSAWSKRQSVLAGLVGARFAVLFARAFLPLGLPEIWRQTDTLGVALRYWLRWTVELNPGPRLLPAILNSGDTLGIMPMEFPLLNLISAPFFALGSRAGQTGALLFLFALSLALTIANVRLWRGKLVAGVDAGTAMWLLPLVSIGADWVGKFMPDYPAMLLVLIAVGLSWEKDRPGISGLLAALGLLMKPTSVVVFALWLVRPYSRSKIKATSVWLFPALAIAGFYYTYGVSFIREYRELEMQFAIRPPQGLRGLYQFVADPWGLAKFWIKNAFFPFGVCFLLPLYVYRSLEQRRNWFGKLWLVLLIQIVGIAFLAGNLSLTHDYYFMGIMPVTALLVLQAWDLARVKGLRFFIAAAIGVHLFELCYLDFRSQWHRPPLPYWTAQSECGELKRRHPEFPWGRGEVFRSSPESYPALGLCFGEREGSRLSPYGFFWKDGSLPAECQKVDEMSAVQIVTCR